MSSLASLTAAAHLRSSYDVILLRKDVHEFPLSLIAPLGPQHDGHLGVESLLCGCLHWSILNARCMAIMCEREANRSRSSLK